MLLFRTFFSRYFKNQGSFCFRFPSHGEQEDRDSRGKTRWIINEYVRDSDVLTWPNDSAFEETCRDSI